MSLKTLFSIYNSLILPYLFYGLVAWGQAAKSHLQKIIVLQKRTVRLINFAPFRSHAVPFFIPCLEKYSQSEARITVAHSAVRNG